MISEFKTYVDNTKLFNHKILITPQQVVIITLPTNSNFIFNYVLLFLSIILIPHIPEISIFVFMILVMVTFINLWFDMESVNRIILDLKSRHLTVRSRNPIKLMLAKEKQIGFSDIISCYCFEKRSPKSFTTYQLLVKLNTGSSVLLTDFTNEEHAIRIANELEKIIKK